MPNILNSPLCSLIFILIHTLSNLYLLLCPSLLCNTSDFERNYCLATQTGSQVVFEEMNIWSISSGVRPAVSGNNRSIATIMITFDVAKIMKNLAQSRDPGFWRII